MKNRKTFLFVFAILLLLILGFALGEMIGNLNHFQQNDAATSSFASMPVDFYSQEFESSTDIVPVSGLAAGGLSDALLKSNVWNALLDYERKQNCADVTNRAIRLEQINEADSFWVEDWSVEACGQIQTFRVKFTPDQVGGTIYVITKN
jgi:hypothetical protein